MGNRKLRKSAEHQMTAQEISMIDCNLKSRNAIWWLRPLLQLKDWNFNPFMKTKIEQFYIYGLSYMKYLTRKTGCVLYIQLLICINLKILKLTGCMIWQIWNWCVSRFIFFCNAHLSVIYLWFGYISHVFRRASAFAKKETAEITKTTKKLCSNCPPFFWYESLAMSYYRWFLSLLFTL